MLDFTRRGKRWDVWEDAEAGFESFDLMTEGIEKKNIAICWRLWDGRFRSRRNLRTWEFEGRKEHFEGKFEKELDVNE